MIKDFVKKILPERIRLNIRYTIFKLKSVFYRGNNVYCICCDKSFSKFLPHGNIERKNARCPYCLSLERTRLLMYYLQNETNLFEKEKSILHFAPEKAIEFKIKQAKQINYITADINPALADNVIDIQNIPYDKKSFDFVICSHVLGHVPNEKKAIDEIYRVLKVGGKAFVLTLIDASKEHTYENTKIQTPQDRLIHFGEPDLLRLHGNDFLNRLQRPIVKVECLDYSTNFTKAEMEKYQLGDKARELIFVCTRISE